MDAPTDVQCNAAIALGFVLHNENKYLCRSAVSNPTDALWSWTEDKIPQALDMTSNRKEN